VGTSEEVREGGGEGGAEEREGGWERRAGRRLKMEEEGRTEGGR